jgi:hypothetical protein
MKCSIGAEKSLLKCRFKHFISIHGCPSKLHIENNAHVHKILRFLWEAMDLNNKLRKILNGGNLSLRLLIWDH